MDVRQHQVSLDVNACELEGLIEGDVVEDQALIENNAHEHHVVPELAVVKLHSEWYWELLQSELQIAADVLVLDHQDVALDGCLWRVELTYQVGRRHFAAIWLRLLGDFRRTAGRKIRNREKYQ